MTGQIPFARNQEKEISMLTGMANRHGLITGATGTGKTVTLQALAERFSDMGIPCFMADIKGDLSGIARPGGDNPKVQERVRDLGLHDYAPQAHPVTFWDVFGEQGHPIRATVSDLGPLLLSRMLELNEVQTGVLNLVFKVADDNGLLLLDMKDLREMLKYVGGNASAFTTDYGTIAPASVGAIQRGLLNLEGQGGDRFFGEPMLNVADLMQTDQGRGVINILAADRLMGAPKLYAMVLLWLLSELFENLPERGDLEKPGLVFFFDEAHLLFEGAPAALVEKIEQVVRLIRSKGVGVFFVTQHPADIPDKVLAQLGNRIQHALRSFSARDLKQVRASAQAMRDNPVLDEESAITDLGVGEALISCLDEQGRPSVVERAMIYPPRGMVGPLSPAERQELIRSSLVAGVYEQAVDRESAYEKLKNRVETSELPTGGGADRQASSGDGLTGAVGGVGGMIGEMLGGASGRGRRREGVVETMAKSVARSVGSQVGRAIVRGLLGSILGGRR